MEFVEELKNTKTIIWVLTGDGHTEYRVLKGVARKYNGSQKVLFFPKLPLGFHFGGGISVLKATKTHISKYNAKKFFCLIDREHIETSDAEKEVESKLREFGFEVIGIQKLPTNDEEVLRVEGKLGTHKFILWVAINGKEKCIEENVAKLLEAEFGESIEPTKDCVKRALKRHNIDIDQIIHTANINKIKRSFPAIHAVLNGLEADKQ